MRTVAEHYKRMEFKLTIELGNDAMQDGAEVAEALEQVAAKVHYELPLVAGEPHMVRDANGNTVGRWEVRDRVVDADLATEVREALEGDSNDAEHDALVSVAEALNITYSTDEDI